MSKLEEIDKWLSTELPEIETSRDELLSSLDADVMNEAAQSTATWHAQHGRLFGPFVVSHASAEASKDSKVGASHPITLPSILRSVRGF